MQRSSKGVVQLEWVCPNCDSRNPGPVKNCENCGAAQPENVQFQRAAEEKLITDEKAVAAAKAGADIHCGFCGTRNPATAATCSQCGADLKGELRARQDRLLRRLLPYRRLFVVPIVGVKTRAVQKPAQTAARRLSLPSLRQLMFMRRSNRVRQFPNPRQSLSTG